jgi:AcrR family transcriptional regulator
MESSVNSRRRYHSPYRQEQARRTRLSILEAALPLFVERGYAGTSLADIAGAAGVALKTVQAVFGTKARLLSDLWDISVVGDDEAIPVAERDWFRATLEEPDPQRQLQVFLQHIGRIKRRVGALAEVVRRAAQGDSEIGVLWQTIQDQMIVDQQRVMQRLADKGVLRKGLDAAEAAEIMGILNHPSVYYLAVVERGWSEERFEAWLVDALAQQLLE